MNFAPVRGKSMRVTRTDECGVPLTDPGDFIVSTGYVSVGYSPETEARDEINEKNAGGIICANDTVRPYLKWYNVEIEFCRVDPEIFVLMTGQTLVEDFGTEPVGVDIGAETVDDGFGLEVWTGVDRTEVACVGGVTPYGYVLTPWLTEGFITDFTVENALITFTLEARTNKNHGWGVGPYDVVDSDGIGTAGPLLTALPAEKQLRIMQTTIAPPVPA